MDLHQRIGAWLTSDGCFFRVWAPHAGSVTVLVQDGPYWEAGDTVLQQGLVKEGEYWSGTVSGVRAWQLYRFEIQHPTAGILQRLDPAARDVLSSELTRADPSSRNGSVVLGTDPFPWAPFQTPRFENFIIYQFHIGSFAGRGDEFNKPSSDFQDVESKFSYIREMGFNCIRPPSK